MTKLQIRITVLTVLAVLALPATALAGSSEEGYGGPNNVVSGVQGGENNPPAGENVGTAAAPNVASVASPDDAGVLPFTGTDLAILAAAGLILVAFGYGLRHLTRHPSQP
jgi:hypothetical protein